MLFLGIVNQQLLLLCPKAPEAVTASNETVTSVDLAWNLVTFDFGAIKEYNIYRDGSKVGTSLTNTFSDTGLSASTTYSYEVTAVTSDGRESAKSTPATSVTTLAV